jgi:carbonic anhydrase
MRAVKASDTLKDMQTPVDALVITCMDARLHRADRPYLGEYVRGKHIGLRTWDLLALHGGARGLTAPDASAQKAVLLDSVKIAHDLHSVLKVVLVNHSDCEAYGGAKAFPDATEEYRKHATDLRAGRDALRAFLPNLEVRLLFATIENRADGPFVTFDEVR